MWFAMLAAAVAAAADLPPFINPGTPVGIPPSFDCKARTHAWEFGKATLPRRGDFKTLYDALQLQACGVPGPAAMDKWVPPKLPTPSSSVLFVSPTAAAGGDGTISKPLPTIQAAVDKAAGTTGTTILLRAGVHYTGHITITTAHQNLTIQNYNGEAATISGGVPIKAAPGKKWEQYKVVKRTFVTFNNSNNVYGKVMPKSDAPIWGVVYLGMFETFAACQAAAGQSPKGPFKTLTWHDPQFRKNYAQMCYGGTTDAWAPFTQEYITSGRWVEQNTWKLDVSGQGIKSVPGLRFKGQRAVRAKYPNGDPELSGEYFWSQNTNSGAGQYVNAWVTAPTTWIGPENPDQKWNDIKNIIMTGTDWPGVIWPLYQEGRSRWTGEGDWGEYHLGQGGFCNDVDPPFGYWCSQAPPRGSCYNHVNHTSCGATQTHMSPSGFYYNTTLPQASKYSKPKGAVVQVWRGAARWYTNQCIVDSIDTDKGTVHFDQEVGCNQGGEGEVNGAEWWIENVLEECDTPGEYFFDEDAEVLYYSFNTSYTPDNTEQFVSTDTKVIFNVTGTQSAPVKGFALKGVEIRDTAYTYVGTDPADIHGLPSGGDWALQRSGAVLLEGTEGAEISDSLVTRVDGNGVFLSNYNSMTRLVRNEFSWIGDSAMAAWGSTGHCLNKNCSQSVPWGVGPDGREGNYPKDTYVAGNLVREIGIWQKQSSMWFQAITMNTHLEGNVHFNGPRAGINLNDGFGGGDVIEGNLLANCVRESGDHGPINTWDRVPYITNNGMQRVYNVANTTGPMPGHVKATTGSVIPTFRIIASNFFFDVYSSQEGVDNDDGSSYYLTHSNYFVYAFAGLKEDFGGQWNHHYDNVYAYVERCFWGFGNNLAFYNNTCQCTDPNVGYMSTCNGHTPPSMTIKENDIYSLGNVTICDRDQGTVVHKQLLSDDAMTAAGTAILKPFPKPAGL